MKYLLIALAMTSALLAACNPNNNYGLSTTATATATPSPNPALGAPINISIAPNYTVPATPSPNPSATATATPAPASQVTFTFLPLTSPPLTASVFATELNYTGPLALSLTNCTNPTPITVTPIPTNPQQLNPASYTATAVARGSCTISVTDNIGHTTTIVVTVP